MRIIKNPDLSDSRCQGISKVYESSGMGNQHNDAKIRAMYRASSYFLLAELDGEVIGILRAFGDGLIVTWLAEIAVHDSHRRKAVGSQLVKQFLKDHEHTAIFTFCIKNRGQEEFFQHTGLTPKEIITGCSRAALKKYADQ